MREPAAVWLFLSMSYPSAVVGFAIAAAAGLLVEALANDAGAGIDWYWLTRLI